MSCDETDGSSKAHPPVFRIVAAQWQSDDLRNFLWVLDMFYREDWAHPIHGRASVGNPPRTRTFYEDGPSEEGSPPKGLWRNCYNPVWLESLKPYQRKELEIIEEDYDFSF